MLSVGISLSVRVYEVMEMAFGGLERGRLFWM